MSNCRIQSPQLFFYAWYLALIYFLIVLTRVIIYPEGAILFRARGVLEVLVAGLDTGSP